MSELIMVFVLSVFLGFEAIARVPQQLHTPLMSGANAISGIAVVGALMAVNHASTFVTILGFLGIAMAMVNVVGGFMVTHRMLEMFQPKKKAAPSEAAK
jgi:NAD(P) transhydrogenase subunit alpha